VKVTQLRSLATVVLLTGSVWAQDPPAPASKSSDTAKTAAAPAQMQARGPTRIDFDDRLLQGQTNKLGAVYLYQRRAPAQPSLLSRRTSFRDEISRDLLE
jgi:uncharacterized membrane-anchored protein